MFERSIGSLRDIPTAYRLSDGDDILHLGKSLLPIASPHSVGRVVLDVSLCRYYYSSKINCVHN